jgi:2-succinyl-6-hydroxy-2,4-cyclohexadiene-1-carboxylate synthase
MFDELAIHLGRSIIAPDLPGHGGSATRQSTINAAVAGVAATMIDSARPAPLIGYSMGGRVALRVTLEHPDLVERLVLVSTTAGIDDKIERRRRMDADEAQATVIERDGVDVFLDEWLARPMFAGLARRGDAWQADDRKRRAANTAVGLAASLRGMGTGVTPSLTERLGELSLPVLVVAGSLDPRYVREARSIATHINGAEMAIVSGCGHSVVGEAPETLAALFQKFLST